MTSKLKCPFCGQELIREGMNHWWCSCNIEHQGKELYGTTALWQALIESHKSLVLSEQSADKEIHRLRDLLSQSQKDLEIARKALDKADRFFEGTIGLYQSEMIAIIKTALEQIDHIADVSKMVEHKE
jgi:hypothetical protein